jgi:type I restriction enzyme S subunit
MLSDKILRFTVADGYREWLLHCLRSPWGRAEIERLATGNQLSMRNIGQDRIRRVRIPMAPRAEIKAIVSTVERSLSRIEGVRRAIEESTAQAVAMESSILAKAFRGELAPQDPNDEPASTLIERLRASRQAGDGEPKRKRRSPGE